VAKKEEKTAGFEQERGGGRVKVKVAVKVRVKVRVSAKVESEAGGLDQPV
jgi:hypothetical protein